MILLEWLFLTISPCDAAEPWQLGFQDAATPMMQGIIDLHHDIFFFLILILVFVSRILVRAFSAGFLSKMEKGTETRITAASASSSSTNSNRSQKDEEMRKIRLLAVTSVQQFLDKYEQQILVKFPRTSSILRSPEFFTGLVEGLLADAGLASEPMTLAQLKAVHTNLVSAVERIEHFQNNDIYDNIQNSLFSLEKGREFCSPLWGFFFCGALEASRPVVGGLHHLYKLSEARDVGLSTCLLIFFSF